MFVEQDLSRSTIGRRERRHFAEQSHLRRSINIQLDIRYRKEERTSKAVLPEAVGPVITVIFPSGNTTLISLNSNLLSLAFSASASVLASAEAEAEVDVISIGMVVDDASR